jgi:predicted DNA-binding antitoxin AbrB/MazE fold protein
MDVERNMTRQIEAVYENGVLRPLEQLPLGERERVRLTVTNEMRDPLEELIDREFLDSSARELAGIDRVPTLAEVQTVLAGDKSSWAETIIAERRKQ